MKEILKSGWFFIITAIFVFINLFDGEYLRVITLIAVYFFIEISIFLIAFRKCEDDEDDS